MTATVSGKFTRRDWLELTKPEFRLQDAVQLAKTVVRTSFRQSGVRTRQELFSKSNLYLACACKINPGIRFISIIKLSPHFQAIREDRDTENFERRIPRIKYI